MTPLLPAVATRLDLAQIRKAATRVTRMWGGDAFLTWRTLDAAIRDQGVEVTALAASWLDGLADAARSATDDLVGLLRVDAA